MEFLKKSRIAILFCLITIGGNFNLTAQSELLEGYISNGLENNLALRQKLASYEQSIQDLKEARGMFFPSVSVNARYTVAKGGRTILFPVGDLLNGAYSTLNSLSAIHNLIDPHTGGPIHFPQLENQEFQFYRPQEQETKIELIQPIFNPKIYFNNKIKSDLVLAKQADAETYKRNLVAEIKTSYYNYLKTIQLNNLIDNTKKLLEENIRVNEKLFENDKVTIDNVYRSKAELGKLEQKKAEAIQMRQSASAYFNFLLNKPLDSEIDVDENIMLTKVGDSLDVTEVNALKSREELQMLESYQEAANHNYKLNRSSKIPTLTGAVNYGFQGEKYSFTKEDDFMLASLVLKWDIFTGRQNEAKIQHARLEQKILDQKQTELENAIKLDVMNAWYTLKSAYASIESAELQVETSRKAYDIVAKKYEQGQAGLIEYIDARTTMTNAEENLIISRYEYLIGYAKYELAAGLYNLE